MLLCERDDLVCTLDRVGRAGHLWCARTCGDVTGRDLVAEVANRLGGRADPGQPCVDDRLGEIGVLRQEPVAGVDGVGTRVPADRDDLGDVEVALSCGSTAQGVGLIGEAHMEGVSVRFCVHGHGRQAGIPTGSDDTDRDFATIGNEDLAHQGSLSGTGVGA